MTGTPPKKPLAQAVFLGDDHRDGGVTVTVEVIIDRHAGTS
jgi:hypothetical protein